MLMKLLIAFTAILTPDAINLNPLVIKLLLNKKSLIATIASPILAVTVNKSVSNALRTMLKTLKANFNPPPVTVITISNIANTPLNVRLSLSAVWSVIINCLVNF